MFHRTHKKFHIKEMWNAIDFHVRYSLFVTSGRVTDPVFEEKFTEEELQKNGITGDLLHSNPTRYGTSLRWMETTVPVLLRFHARDLGIHCK